MNEGIYNYARLLIKRGVNVQKKPLIIQGSTEISYFINLLSEEAYKAGATHVEVIYQDDGLDRLKYEYETIEMVKTVPSFIVENLMYYMNQDASYIRLVSKDPGNLSGLDMEKVTEGTLAYNHAVKEVTELVMEHKIRWCIAAVPGQKWAELVFPDAKNPVDELWSCILQCCFCDKDNPIGLWDEHVETMKSRMAKLNQMNLDRLHFTSSNGTDILIGLCDNHRWRGGASKTPEGILFSPNIPTYELYTVPHKDRVDGTVVSTKPLSYLGNVICSGFRISYKDGKVVHIKAGSEREEKLLYRILDTYDGSERLGEVAIVDSGNPISRTDRLFYNTLLDENAACHLAMGNGISTAIDMSQTPRTPQMPQTNDRGLGEKGLNQSDIHIDYMIGTSDMNCIGISKDDKQYVIMERGKIV